MVHASFGSANASLAKFFREQAAVMATPRAAPVPRPAHPDAAFAPLGARLGGGGGGGETGGRPKGLAA